MTTRTWTRWERRVYCCGAHGTDACYCGDRLPRLEVDSDNVRPAGDGWLLRRVCFDPRTLRMEYV